MAYDAKQIASFETDLEKWKKRAEALCEELIFRDYIDPGSKAMASHGVTRRIRTLLRCIDQIYRHVPAQAETPSPTELQDASIFLQAFVISVYGALDNLARLWVLEKKPCDH